MQKDQAAKDFSDPISKDVLHLRTYTVMFFVLLNAVGVSVTSVFCFCD